MGTNPTKAADNIYCQCRKRAAMYNDKLHSREGASELLGISVSTLAGYELGTVKNMPPEMVVLMADLYNSPELKNHFCTSECPIGRASVAQLEVAELDRLTVKLLSSLRKVDGIKDDLLDITADGVIDQNETSSLEDILQDLERISRHAQELKLYAERLQAERR